MQLVNLLYVTSNQKHIIFFFCDLCDGSHPISSAVQNLLQVDGQGLKVFFNTNTQNHKSYQMHTAIQNLCFFK